MKVARIVVLTIALGAGGMAAYLARGTDAPKPEAQPVAQLPTTEILVARSDIGLGQSVKADDLQWQTWPASTASNSFIRRDNDDSMKSAQASSHAAALRSKSTNVLIFRSLKTLLIFDSVEQEAGAVGRRQE